jgi:non-specific serine/threonine protein kinase
MPIPCYAFPTVPNWKPLEKNFEQRLPKEWAGRILRDTLLALQFLHSNGIIQGGVHPGNILFTINLPSLQSDSPDILQQHPHEHEKLERLDGKVDLWAPKYLLEQKSLYEYTSLDLDPLVDISDFWRR